MGRNTIVSELPDDAITYIFTWETSHDERVCPICWPLNGREYAEQDLFGSDLIDPSIGRIWDLNADHSLTHPNCRCQIAVCICVDWGKLPEFEQLAKRNLGMAMYSRAPGTSIAELRGEVKSLKKDIVDAKKEATKLNELWTTYLSLARKSGLPEDITQVMTMLQQYRILVQTTIKTVEYLNLVLATGGPVAWALFLGSAALTGVMLADQIELRRPLE